MPHSPEPWKKVLIEDKYENQISIFDRDEYRVATIYGHDRNLLGRTDPAILTGNGNLLFAAPALLAVCKMVLRYHEEQTGDHAKPIDFCDVLDAAEEAIKLAEPEGVNS